MRAGTALASISLMLTGCVMTGRTTDSPSPGARALLADASGASRGTATFRQDGGVLVVQVTAEGMTPGIHGIHIHGVGLCDAPDFKTAGAHWNPAMKQHGRDNPLGSHQGDLPNLDVGPDGRGKLRFVVPMANLSELLDGDGSTIVVHSGADDYRTDPSGNSGARIACAVITRTP